MVLEAIKQFNWVDIFVVILLIRSIYIAGKKGIFITFFNLGGIIFANYVAMHYFTNISDFFEAHIPTPPNIPLEIWDILALVILVMLGNGVFVILRMGFFRFVKTETVSFLNKWGAAILGTARGFILSSLIIFLMSIPVIDYFSNSVRDSFFANRMIKISIGTYTFLWNNVASKFMPQEKFNNVVLEIQEEALPQ